MQLVVRVNGHHHAFMSEFGRDSARDRYTRADLHRSANTSCSVFLREERTGATRLHLLFDVGLGVVNSLLAAGHGREPDELTGVFITHPHLDHHAELDRLANSLQRAHRLRGDDTWRLAVYCTSLCAERIVGERGVFWWLGVGGRRGRVVHHPVTPCEPVRFEIDG